MAIYKDRKLVPEGETWNLDPLLGKKKLDVNIDQLLKVADKLASAYKRRLDSLESFVAYHKLDKEWSERNESVSQYLHLQGQQDTLSPLKAKEMELSMKLQPLYQVFAAEDAEIIKNRAKVQKYLADDRLKDYRRYYELIFRKEPHTLPESVAAYSMQVRQAIESNVEIFSVLKNAETKYESAVDAKGKKHEVSSQSLSKLLRSGDRVLRKNAYDSYGRGIATTKETFAKLIAGHFLAQHRLAQARGFKNQIEASLFPDNASTDLVESLYRATKDNMAPYFRQNTAHREFLARALKLKYEQVMPYDTMYELFPNKQEYSVKQAKDLVLASVRPLGERYVAAVQLAFDKRWIDFHMTPNKRSGAFSSTNRFMDMQPILMNFDGSLDSVSTLAHEVGHSMHSFHCRANNPYTLSDYPIFTAEVASNFSELLLTEEILRSAKSDVVRFNALASFLGNFTGNVYSQMIYSEYEYKISEALVQNKAINTWDEISKIYEEVRKPYIANHDWQEKYAARYRMSAVTVPHFYYNFYVYKYSIGMIGALALMSLLKKDSTKGVKNYIDFISSGTQRWPADVLKSVGVDLKDQKTLKNAFDLYAGYVQTYIDLGKKLLKIKVAL